MTAPIDSARARKRRLVKDLVVVAEDAPVAYVESPMQTVLASVQRIVGVELAYLEATQATGVPMPAGDAKKLLNLISALEKSVSVGRELSDAELGKMSDDELTAQLTAELESLRTRSTKT